MNKKFPKKDEPFILFAEALMGGGASEAIERSEKRGQEMLVSDDVLPKKFNSGTRKQLEDRGVVFGEEADDLFVFITLPPGWKKVATDHNMWSTLVDEKGEEVASIFYKAAFYDRDAFINVK